MWQTSCGESVMSEAEAELLREVIDAMVDEIVLAMEFDESHQAGVSLFDNLQPTQQLLMLYKVANALLRDDVPEPDLTAVNEAAVYALFRQLYTLIELEIDHEQFVDDPRAYGTGNQDLSPHLIRSKTIAAYEQGMSPEEFAEFVADGDIPDIHCNDMSQWDFLIEGLADRILWDRDFEMEHVFADNDPMKSEFLKTQMGVDEGYYTAVAGDLSDTKFSQLKDEIRELVCSE